MKSGLKVLVIGLVGGLLGAIIYDYYLYRGNEGNQIIIEDKTQPESIPVIENYKSGNPKIISLNDDFVDASQISTSAVVFIKNISERNVRVSFLDLFFGESGRTSQTVSTGSGVIYSSDGYIVTNNHVIDDATRIEVIHKRNTYDAMLVGTDPSSDIAVLKISSKGLPTIPLGSSKDLQVGEWVLAVGNPFNLTSTVTAGIVSAKGRNINLLKSKFPIESFIQTDAAINPGNSGGALVNKKGELVGINTAILSRTGSYAGYGFAVPIDIVNKIFKDIVQYGEVQQAFFGGDVSDITDDLIKRLDLDYNPDLGGVALTFLQPKGTAVKNGFKEGDIIVAINAEPLNDKSRFDEIISSHSPGDKISIDYIRNKKAGNIKLILTNREGNTEIIKTEVFSSRTLGADLELVPKVERDLLNIENGVRIKKVYNNGIIRELGISEDFIVTYVNNYPIKEPEDLSKILSDIRGRVRIEGIDRKGTKGYYSFYFR